MVSCITKMNTIYAIEGHISSGGFVKKLFSHDFGGLCSEHLSCVILSVVRWIIRVDAIHCQLLDARGVFNGGGPLDRVYVKICIGFDIHCNVGYILKVE